MKRREVVFAPEAARDLEALYDYIAERAGPNLALAFLSRLEGHCLSFDVAGERGTRRDEIRPGLRISSFERRVTLAFTVDATRVVFLRIFAAGADWEAALPDD